MNTLIDFHIKSIDIHGKRIKLVLHIANLNHHNVGRIDIPHSYTDPFHGALFVYNVANKETLTFNTDLIKQLSGYIHHERPNVLVGHDTNIYWCDSQWDRQVSYEEGIALANKHNMKFFETNWRDQKSVQKPFNLVINEVLFDGHDYTKVDYYERIYLYGYVRKIKITMKPSQIIPSDIIRILHEWADSVLSAFFFTMVIFFIVTAGAKI